MTLYRKKRPIQARPYVPGEDITGVSVRLRPNDDPSKGGMIAWDPANPRDRWFIAQDYFDRNYEIDDSHY